MSYLPRKKKSEVRSPDYSHADKIRRSTEWKKLSRYKRECTPLCEECLRVRQAPTPATEVHHIISIEENPSMSFAYDNLESLCHACHVEKTKPERK